MQLWNDTDNAFTKLWRKNEARKQRAADIAFRRDLHSQIVQILHDTMPKTENRKLFMEHAQVAADEILKEIYPKTKQGTRHDTA